MMMMTMTVVMTIMMTVAVTTMTSGCPAREGDDNGNDVDDLTQVALPGRVEERLLALEGDKDQLHMQVIVIIIIIVIMITMMMMRRVRRKFMMMVQVSMLSDQIHNQTDKILDLERTLDSKKEALKKTEDLLQIEMINRLNILDSSFLWN